MATEKMTAAFETELGHLQRRLETEFLNRFERHDKELFTMTRHAGQADATIQSIHFTMKRNQDLINKIDQKVETLEEMVEPMDFQRQISEGLLRARQHLQQDMEQHQASILPAVRDEMKDLERRFNMFELWFRDTITPELVQLKCDLEAESNTREAADEDVVQVLARYARILHRHFGPIDEETT
eukprot:GEMP01082764.1.p1 GENE.GEMP01082764.1~~GEMP01082764.1.p1  ORF type:complete len:184 (+),score=45.88 GEMP01082764.1:308-859(+)